MILEISKLKKNDYFHVVNNGIMNTKIWKFNGFDKTQKKYSGTKYEDINAEKFFLKTQKVVKI
jgi:hypothetical protein